ncbi:ATP-binding protein [Salisaeta longa]|uniref:ATP-binding protein n=1 Tax=Salisaeta longa TaxID=503170 RepID=UPI00040A8C76|nr:hypothetical protein [Salisaeta longa]
MSTHPERLNAAPFSTDDSTPVLAFSHIQVHRLYGLNHNLKVEDLTDGVNIIYGSNASGKTTLARAIQMMIWAKRGSDDRPVLSGTFRMGASAWHVERDGNRVKYQKDAQAAPPPSVPPASYHARYHLYLPDLLAATDGADAFAKHILEEAQGGIDLEGAGRNLGFGVPTRNKNKTARAVEDARSQVRKTKAKQEKLREKERSLNDLRRQHKKAQEAGLQVRALEQAMTVADARKKHREAVDRLETFSEAHEHLRGDEDEQLDAHLATIEKARDVVEQHERIIDKAQKTLGESILPDGGLSASEVEALRALKDALKEAEKRVEDAKTQVAKAKKREQETWNRLDAGMDREKAAAVGLPQIQTVETHVEKAEDLRGSQEALKVVQRLLEADAPTPSAETLQDGVRALHRWLQQPNPAEDNRGVRWVVIGSAAGVVLLGSFAYIAHGVSLWIATIAVVLGLLIIGADVLRARVSNAEAAARDDRSAYERNFERTGLATPQWTRAAVEKAADRLLDALRGAAVETAKIEEWERLAPEYKKLANREEKLKRERERLSERLGFNVGMRSLAWLVERLSEWQTAREEAEAAEAARDEARRLAQNALNNLNETLDALKLGDAASAAEAAGALKTLEQEREVFRQAKQDLDGAEAEKTRAEKDIKEAQDAINEIYASTGVEVGNESTLRDLCDRHEDYKETQQAESRAQMELETERRQLHRLDGHEAWMDEDVRSELAKRLESARTCARREEELREKIGTIERGIEEAKEEGTLEEARAAYRETVDALARERHEDYNRAVGAALLKCVQAKTRDQGLPPVFDRARELFAAITNHRYELILDRDAGVFRARDRIESRGFDLDKLSSGTKVQLLLAVRVAFVESQEETCRLPLVLDETLANSDEEKATAIIDAIQAVCASGRQVFYLTAQKDEVMKWREHISTTNVPCKVVTLGDIAPIAEDSRENDVVIPVPPLRTAPIELKGKSHTALRDILKVPAWTPRQPVSKLHLWYLIEDPKGLADLVRRGTETWGQLAFQYERTGNAATGLSSDKDDCIRARAKAVESWQDAWRVGRGKAIGPEALKDCGAVSSNYLEDLVELAKALKGDAEKLLRELRERNDERTKGFHSTKADEFEDYCYEHGYIDMQETNTPTEMWQYVTADLAQELRDGLITRSNLERLFRGFADDAPHPD